RQGLVRRLRLPLGGLTGLFPSRRRLAGIHDSRSARGTLPPPRKPRPRGRRRSGTTPAIRAGTGGRPPVGRGSRTRTDDLGPDRIAHADTIASEISIPQESQVASTPLVSPNTSLSCRFTRASRKSQAQDFIRVAALLPRLIQRG